MATALQVIRQGRAHVAAADERAIGTPPSRQA